MTKKSHKHAIGEYTHIKEFHGSEELQFFFTPTLRKQGERQLTEIHSLENIVLSRTIYP